MRENSRQGPDRQPERLPGAGAALLSLGPTGYQTPGRRPHKAAGDGDRLSPLWRVFGGTLLSIAALVTVTLTQQFSSILTEVRQDLNRMHESRGELARKDEVLAATKDLQAMASGLAALRAHAMLLEQQLDRSEAERKQLAREVRELREWMAATVGRPSAVRPADVRGEVGVRR